MNLLSKRDGFFWVMALCASLCLGLSGWQWYRLSWKEDLLTTLKERLNSPVKALETLLAQKNHAKDQAFYPISVEGVFQHQEERHLLGRTHRGEIVYHVITPFLLTSGSILLVNRGWVPAKITKDQITRPTGPMKIQGYLRHDVSKSFFTPKNDYKGGHLYFLDPKEYAKQRQQPAMYPFYLMKTSKEDPQQGFPRSFLTPIPDLRNFHRQYALTWLALAMTCLLGFYFYRRRHPFVDHGKRS